MLKISKSLHSLFSLFDALPLCRLVAWWGFLLLGLHTKDGISSCCLSSAEINDSRSLITCSGF